MKRNLSNVTKNHVQRLKAWVDSKGPNYCPFVANKESCVKDICYEVFPRLILGTCPCRGFQLWYVKKVAREIIKELS